MRTKIKKHMCRAKDILKKFWTYALTIMLRPTDLFFIIRGIIKGAHVRELLNITKELSWLRRFDIKTVIDIGASTGQFASACLYAMPEVFIYSFEPEPESFRILQKKMLKSGRWKGYNIALGSKEGIVRFYRSEFAESSSLLPMTNVHLSEFPWTEFTNEIMVKMTTLDNLLSELDLQPGVLMKIDVQGYELEVLKGAVRTLQRVDICIIECSFEPLYENSPLWNDVYSFLYSHGFEYRGAWDQLRASSDNRILQQDSIFIKRL